MEGELGAMLTLDTEGGLLEMVTALDDVGSPSEEPSFGVTIQKTVSPLSQKSDVKVLVVSPILFPLTIHMYV